MQLAADLTKPHSNVTTVPSLNPRLELWLLGKFSGEPCLSPPLPSSIVPPGDMTSSEEVGSKGKPKGFMTWLSGLGKTTNKSMATKEYEKRKKSGSAGKNREEEVVVDIPMGEVYRKPKWTDETAASPLSFVLAPSEVVSSSVVVAQVDDGERDAECLLSVVPEAAGRDADTGDVPNPPLEMPSPPDDASVPGDEKNQEVVFETFFPDPLPSVAKAACSNKTHTDLQGPSTFFTNMVGVIFGSFEPAYVSFRGL